MMTGRAASATLAIAALSLAAGISYCILHGPLTLNDSLGPILDSRQADSVREVYNRAIFSAGYWRPLRLVQIKLVVDAFPLDSTRAFKAVQVVLVCLTFLCFAIWLRPRSLPELAAALVAVMMLAGHHSFFILFSETYPINHFLEMLALTLAVACLARGRPRWWKGVLATVLFVIGALTIESGLLIGVAAVACWMVGWRGIPGRGIALLVALMAGYFYLRFGVLDIPSPSLDERATGWWLGRLEASDIPARFAANPLPFYAYNVGAAFLDVLLSEPRAGAFQTVRRWVDGHLPVWNVIQVVSSLIITILLVAALIPALARWRERALDDRDRFVLLAFAMVAANSVMSFGYVKDEVLSIGAAFYAAGAFAVLTRLCERMDGDWSWRTGACAGMLVVASLLWTSRATGTLFQLQASAFKVAYDWGSYSLEREIPEAWSDDGSRRTYFAIRRRNLSYDVPAPALTLQPRLDSILEIQ